jgi:hypothetical protein
MAKHPSYPARGTQETVARAVETQNSAAAPVTRQAESPRNTAIFQVGDIGSVCKRGRFYGAGEAIELSEADANRLLQLGCIKAI